MLFLFNAALVGKRYTLSDNLDGNMVVYNTLVMSEELNTNFIYLPFINWI